MFSEQLLDLIKDRCRDLGLTEVELSQAVAGHRTLVTNIRRGRSPNGERLKEICDTLGLEFYIGPPRKNSASADHGQISEKHDTGNLREELEVMRKAEAQAEALRAEIAGMAARLEATTSASAEPTRRIREPELIIPTLILLATRPDGVATTRDIIRHMEDWFQPAGEDAEPLKGRADSRFSQIARNMISHRKDAGSFIRNGYAEYLGDLQGLRITDKGRKLLKEVVNEW